MLIVCHASTNHSQRNTETEKEEIVGPISDYSVYYRQDKQHQTSEKVCITGLEIYISSKSSVLANCWSSELKSKTLSCKT